MANVSYRLEDLKKVIVGIGYVGENDHMHVLIDCKEAFDEYPDAVPTMAIVPPVGESYPKVVTRNGDVVEWLVKNSDVAAEGDGEFQITFTEGEVIKKSVNGRFRVIRSISGSGNAPSGYEDWETDANEKLAEVEEATQKAEAAASHQPYIGIDGYWYTWNGEEFVKNVKAQGEKGDPGDPGSPGDPTQLIDDTAGEGQTEKTWSADKLNDQFGGVLSAITKLTPAATASDIGKALIVKTVADGVPTSYEYGEAGSIDPQDIADAVDEWLDEHPEATTTVEDGSITKAKLNSDLKLEIGNLEKGTGTNIIDVSDFTENSSSATHTTDTTNETITVSTTSNGTYQGARTPADFIKNNLVIGRAYRLHAKTEKISGSPTIKIAIRGTQSSASAIAKSLAITAGEDGYMDFVVNKYMKDVLLAVTWGSSASASVKFSEIWLVEYNTTGIDNIISSEVQKIIGEFTALEKGTGEDIVSVVDFTLDSSSASHSTDQANGTITVNSSGSSYQGTRTVNTFIQSKLVVGRHYRLHAKAEETNGEADAYVAIRGTQSSETALSSVRLHLGEDGEGYVDFVVDNYMRDIVLLATWSTAHVASVKFSNIWLVEFTTTSNKDDFESVQSAFMQNVDVDYIYDSVGNANYTLLRIYRKRVDGKTQFPFVYAPNGTDPATKSALDIAMDNWLLTINAGVFSTETWMGNADLPLEPLGILIQNGIVLQNGPCGYTSVRKALTIDENGDMACVAENADTSQLIANGVISAVCGFGSIIENYEAVDITYIPDRTSNAQRQIIGQFGNGDYAILTCEGRNYDHSDGWTIEEAQNVCIKYGLKFAFVLDGGGSAETVLGKKQINTIYEGTTGRKVPTFIVFNGKNVFETP